MGAAGSALEPIAIGSGTPGDTLAYITNAGTTATTVTMLVEVGAGLRSGDILDIGQGQNGVNAVSCPVVSGHPQQRLCRLPSIGPGDEIVLDVEVRLAPSHIAGSTAALTLTVAPTSPGSADADPGDNSAASIYEFAGVANLDADIGASAPTTTVGSTLAVTVTVTNTGPDRAPQATADVELNNDSGSFEVVALSASPDQHNELYVGTSITWPIGDLEVAQSATAILTLRALTAGTVTLGVTARSIATDPACAAPDDCPVIKVPLIALAPVITPPPAGSSNGSPPVPGAKTPVTAGSGDELADTGAPTVALSLLAIAWLLVGAGLIRVGRRQPEADLPTGPDEALAQA
jgi:hypothetical protein